MKAKFEFGSEFEILTKGELDDSLGKVTDLWRQYAQGLKKPTKEFRLGTNSGIIPGPPSGLSWMLMLLGARISGADAVILYQGDQANNHPIGSSPAQAVALPAIFTFPARAIILRPGENLFIQAFTGSTNIIDGWMSVVEAPTEQQFKLIGG